MVSTKLNIGKIPISKGEYQEGIAYQRLNQVTMLGSTYQSKIDDNTSAPAQMGADGAVENINTDKWLCVAVGNVSAAKKVVYNNETSGLEAENVQEAIDEVGSRVSDLYDKVNKDANLIYFATNPGYISHHNTIEEDANWVHSDYIPFGYIENVPYNIYGNSAALNIAFYDIDKTYLNAIYNNTEVNNSVVKGTFNAPVNTAYIRISAISDTFKKKLGNPTQYIGNADLLNFVIDSSNKLILQCPYKTVELKNCVERICLYGDSISSNDYDGYKIAMQNLTDVNNVYTAGWSGATTAQLTEDTRLNRVFEYMPDLIIIELGGNDIGDTVGTFGLNPTQTKVAETSIKKDYSGTYFIQAVDYIIRKILNKYKKPPYIAVMTPTAQKRKGGENTWNLHRNWVNKRNAVIECCIKNNVHCIDMFNLWGVDMSKEPLWESPTDIVNSKGIYTMDGLHPNKEGFERFAQVITSQVKVENHVNKQFGNSLFTSNKNALGTSTDPLHRTCYMRKVDDNLLGVKFRVGVYPILVCFCVFDESGSVIDKYSIKASNITQTHTVIFGDDAKAYSVMTLAASFEKSELTEYYKKAPINESMSNESKGILWLGTSIPEGKVNGVSYPIIVGKRLGVNVINKSLGSSFLSTGCYNLNNPMTNLTSKNLDVGKCLTETVEEKENRFREKVNDNTISEDQLNIIKSYSFENLVLPYLDKVDTVVIDHGYNDRLVIQQDLKDEGFDQLDWQSRDKGCFIGAVNFLIDRIKEKYPRMRIILSGHYQNNDDVCRYVCAMQSEIAAHFGYPILRLWEYAAMSPQVYVKGTENYISEFNKKYSTSYRPQNANSEGNITELQINCLDTVHPHSDLSGVSINKIGIILTKLIGGIINV